MITIGIGHLGGVVPLLIGLFVSGFVMALWDVAMNIQGALVEQRLGRSIMSRFHAGFSIGTVAAALIGTAMVALHVPVAVHLTVVGLAISLLVPRVTRAYSTMSPPSTTRQPPPARPGASRAPCWSACSCSPSRSPRAPGTTGSVSR